RARVRDAPLPPPLAPRHSHELAEPPRARHRGDHRRTAGRKPLAPGSATARTRGADRGTARLMRLFALALTLFGFHGSIQSLPSPLRTQLRAHLWHTGCPVALSRLRLLTVSYRGFDAGT